jgi:chorismate synthase
LHNEAVSAAMKDSRRYSNVKNCKPHHDSIGKAFECQTHGIPAGTSSSQV